jgi:hypothetical protein
MCFPIQRWRFFATKMYNPSRKNAGVMLKIKIIFQNLPKSFKI